MAGDLQRHAEIKFDGYPAQAHLRNGQPVVYTRAGYDWTLRFQRITNALTALPAPPLRRVLLHAREVCDGSPRRAHLRRLRPPTSRSSVNSS